MSVMAAQLYMEYIPVIKKLKDNVCHKINNKILKKLPKFFLLSFNDPTQHD